LDLQKFPETSTLTAMLKCCFSSKYSSLFFLRHAHVLQILKFYVFSQRNRQALEHVCCQLDKLELSYSSWVMGSLTWSLYTVRQIEKGVLRHPPCRFLGARGLVSILSRFFHSLLLLSHTFLPIFPLFHFSPLLFPFPLFIYLLIYCEKQLLASSRLSVRSSAQNNMAPIEPIFIKFNIWVFFEKSVEKIQVSFTISKDNRYTTWRPRYIWQYFAEFFLEREMFQKGFRENRNEHFMFDNVCSENRVVYGIKMEKNTVDQDMPLMRIQCDARVFHAG